ncbi:hypothetical protein P3T76_004611 [Phytophthora citrophthora]|uniref:Transmembrane protein n=1 Tax=Phytophthora citrophthora TaxID=4793 RepID=A0AAD9GRG1_9STRA|nr:hypothetical protein P3T76_004611 [Phytophthora citrophthora]
MANYFWWRVALSLLNLVVVGCDALHVVLLATVEMTSQTTQRHFGLVALGLSIFFSFACALSLWLVSKRNVGCLMALNMLLFLLHALLLAPLSVAILVGGDRVIGLLEVAFAVGMIAGCVCCRIYSVKTRDEVDRTDALEISYEYLKVEQVAAGC